jgi:ABC-type Na+ efflux pump permease subunit
MNKLWVIAFKDIRNRFTDRRLLLIMLAAPLLISTIIGLAFGGLGRSNSPISHIPVAVIDYDQPGAYGTSFGAMLTSLLTEGQLPADTSASFAACPQNSVQSGTGSAEGSMTLAELIQGTAFDQTVAGQLVADNKIDSPSVPIGNPDYLSTIAKAAVDKGLYTAVVIIPADFSAALTSLTASRPESCAAWLIPSLRKWSVGISLSVPP